MAMIPAELEDFITDPMLRALMEKTPEADKQQALIEILRAQESAEGPRAQGGKFTPTKQFGGFYEPGNYVGMLGDAARDISNPMRLSRARGAQAEAERGIADQATVLKSAAQAESRQHALDTTMGQEGRAEGRKIAGEGRAEKRLLGQEGRALERAINAEKRKENIDIRDEDRLGERGQLELEDERAREESVFSPLTMVNADNERRRATKDWQGNLVWDADDPNGAWAKNDPVGAGWWEEKTGRGKSKHPTDYFKMSKDVRDSVNTLSDSVKDLGHLSTSWKPEFAPGIGRGTLTRLWGDYKAKEGTPEFEMAHWWKNYRKLVQLGERHEMFGSAFTEPEKKAWDAADISEGMSEAAIRRNIQVRVNIVKDKAARRAWMYEQEGYNSKIFSGLFPSDVFEEGRDKPMSIPLTGDQGALPGGDELPAAAAPDVSSKPMEEWSMDDLKALKAAGNIKAIEDYRAWRETR